MWCGEYGSLSRVERDATKGLIIRQGKGRGTYYILAP